MNDRRKKRLLLFVLISFLFHYLILWLMLSVPAAVDDVPEQALDVTIIEKPYKVADILQPKEQVRPEKADFLGMYDSRVPEEQVSSSPANPGAPFTKPAEPEPMQEEPAEGKRDLASLYALKKAHPKVSEPAKPSWEKPGELPEDFYPDYKVGPHTYLNVLRFPEITYFVRLKRIFKMTFSPVSALRHYFYTNQISRGHVEVVLGVTVNWNGQLDRLFVINSSGLKRYDQEALRTVRDSAPFASPPTKLLGEDRKLRMSWTFTVYL